MNVIAAPYLNSSRMASITVKPKITIVSSSCSAINVLNLVNDFLEPRSSTVLFHEVCLYQDAVYLTCHRFVFFLHLAKLQLRLIPFSFVV